MSGLRERLESLGQDQYAERLEENDISLDLGHDSTDADLEKMGVASKGHCKAPTKMSRAARTASTASTPSPRCCNTTAV